MKKVMIMLIPVVLAFTASAQQKEKQQKATIKKSTRVEQMNEPKTGDNSLDGKAFKITLVSKEAAGSSIEKSSVTPSTETSSSRHSEMNSKNERSETDLSKPLPEQKSPAPVDNTATKNTEENQAANMQGGGSSSSKNQGTMNESDITALNGARGKIRFEEGKMKAKFSRTMHAMLDCPYHVTSGTSQLASFYSNCEVNATTTEVNPSSKALDENMVPANSGTNPSTDKDKMVNTAVTSTITGVVNGDVINGSISFYINGKTVMYSFSGKITTSKEKEDELGMN